MNPQKLERNLKLVKLRDSGVEFPQLALMFNITKQGAQQIYKRMKKITRN